MILIEMENGSTIKIELCPDKAPITCKNFEDLVKKGFYDGLIFHRVIRDFMIQGGDPTGTGCGGSGINIKGEFAANGVNGKELAEKRANDCLEVIEELISMGNKTGVYHCKDIKATAKQICWVIEGMFKHSAIIPITEKDIQNQIKLINRMLK